MATFIKEKLSSSTDGRGIKVTATSSSGTTIHTGPTNTSEKDEIWLYAANTDTVARKLTIEWGSTTSPDDLIEISLDPESGLILIVPGLVLIGNASPLVARAFASAANVVSIHGYVHAIV